jgi:hypothetical protein
VRIDPPYAPGHGIPYDRAGAQAQADALGEDLAAVLHPT